MSITKKSLDEISNAIVKIIMDRKNPLDKITLVFHSTKIAQWFKTYFLKSQTAILMNVDFVTLSSFVNDILDPTGEKHILTVSEYQEYIIKALLDNKKDEEIFNYFHTENNINGINLYEFADKLSTVIFNMEFDNEEIKDWQKAIYEQANRYAEAQGNYTPKRIYEVEKNNLGKLDGKVYVFNNSYISALYDEILNKFDNITVFSLDKNAESNVSVTLHAAPSKMREVEWLHTDICKKMNGGASVGNFVVYTPNINDYANTIRRVFQKSKSKFPEVPFRIIGEGTEKRDMITALNILYGIANKGFFTRYDLQKFIKLPMIMFINDLTNDELDAFKKAIETTNTHRNGDGVTEFEDFKKRLLLSMLAGGIVSLTDTKEYLTYSTIDMDECRINKLIDIIDKLSAWANLFKGELSKQMLGDVDLKNISDSLNALFSYENKYGEEKNYLYTDVRTEMERIIAVFSEVKIPAITLLLLLQDAPKRFSSSPADVFAGGITFLSLGVDNIVSEENVYVLGLSSNNFPRVEHKNEIDFSEKHTYTYELDKIAFTNLLKNSDNVSVSFVNRDLKTDEEFFPSIVIPSNVREDYNNKKDDAKYIEEHIISLDENRGAEELYTWRELLEKMRINKMMDNEDYNPTGAAEKTEDSDKKKIAENISEIKTSQIKKYLENTIVYKYSQMLKDSNDEDKSKSEEYEIIDLDGLEKYDIVKHIILAAMEESYNPTKEQYDDFKQKTISKMRLENKLPKDFDEEYFKEYFDKSAKQVIETLKDSFKKVDEFSLDMESNGKKWTLKMTTLCFVKEDAQKLSFVEPREPGNGAKYYLPPYVCALAYIASKNSDDEYTVTLITKEKKRFSATPEYAKNILNEIFNAMQDLDSIKYMDIEFVDSFTANFEKINSAREGGNKLSLDVVQEDSFDILKELDIPTSISSLVNKIGDKKENAYSYGHSSWSRFNDQKILLPSIDFNYQNPDAIHREIVSEKSQKQSLTNITWDMFAEYKKISKLILYYFDVKSQTEEENKNV